MKKLWEYAEAAAATVRKWPACRQNTLELGPVVKIERPEGIEVGCPPTKPSALPAPGDMTQEIDEMIIRGERTRPTFTKCKGCGIKIYGPGRCCCRDPKVAPKTVIEILDTMIAKEAIRLEECRDRARREYGYADNTDFCPLVREQHGRVNALADLRVELLGRGLV
jgi:hypothetical protein